MGFIDSDVLLNSGLSQDSPAVLTHHTNQILPSGGTEKLPRKLALLMQAV